MSMKNILKSLISTLPGRTASGRTRSRKRSSHRVVLETLESRLVPALIVPELNSLPGAFQTLYLDFDGSASFLWGQVPDTGDPYVVRGPSPDDAPIPVPAFTTDADANNFSAAELTNIRNIHAWVAEKFSPFTINVTTVDPGIVEDSRTITCLIGGSSTDWLGKSVGGVARLGGFYDGGEKTCFVFSAGVNRVEPFIGESIAHEAGHVIGLEHQRQTIAPFNIDEYFDGDAVRAPIMGGSPNNTTARGIWWLTNNPSPSWPAQNSPDPQQDDLSVLTNGQVGLSYRTDDYNTNNPANAPTMVFSGAGVLTQLKGIIEQQYDIDDFRFHATGARASFLIKNAPFGGMLAPTASIRLSGTNTVIPVRLAVGQTFTTIEATNLTPGAEYVLRVAGQGQYGDIGQYTIDGSIQQFATFDAATGVLNVGGFVGNNNVTLTTGRNNSLIVEVSVNGGPLARQTFALNAVKRVQVFLGSGDDTLNVPGIVHADGSTIEVSSILGGGFDILRLGNSANNFSTFNVEQFKFEWTPFAGGTSRVRDSGTERVELIGTNDRDVFNIHSQQPYSTFHVFANGDDDRLYIGPEVMASARPVVVFDGGRGADTLELDGSTLTDSQQYIVFNNTVQRFLPGNPFAAGETQFGTAVETLRIRGGLGDDSFKVLSLRAGMTAFLSGNSGADEFRVGDSANPILPLPFSANVRGIVNVAADSGNDRLIVDDAAWGSVGNYTIDSFGVKNTFVNNWVQYESSLERVDFYGRGGETTRLTTPLTSQEFHLFNGAGNGVGTLIVDDRAGILISGPINIALHADRIVRNFTGGYSRAIHYSGYESLTLFSNVGTNAFNVFGTSPDITQQTTIRTGERNDVVTLYPHVADGASAPTIVTPLGFFGGAGSDTLRVDDTASALPIDYLFNNAGGASTVNIFGLGPAAVGAFNDVETIDVLAGDGDDTFTLNSLRSGTGLLLSGGEGMDQLLIQDQETTTSRRYDMSVSQAVGSETLGIFTARAGNSVSNAMNVRFDHTEAVQLDAGSGGNFFKIHGTPASTSVLINTGVGVDTGDLGSSNPAFGAVNSLRDIRGQFVIDGQGGADNLILRDNGDPNARNYTLSPTTLVRSDAPAAPIFYENVETLALNGSAGDNVFTLTSTAFAPAISIDGGGGLNTLDYSAINGDSNSGLVSRYAGEGNAADAVGGNHGTLVNGVAFAEGRVGQAFSFDGVDDYVQVPNSESLETPTISVEAWVNATAPGGRNAHVVAKGASGGTAASYALYTGSTGGLCFYIFDGLTYVESPDAGPGVWDGNWHHIVGTFDGVTVRLYVDGQEIGGGTPTLVQIGYDLPTTNDLFIGSYQGDVGLPFNGLIDEAAIYNRALSLAEIQALSPVSRYQGEGNADDSAGGNHGTIFGDVTFVPGRVGQAFDFHGVNADGFGDYVDLGSDASLDLPGSMSVSLWVRLDTLDASKYFLADFDSLTGNVSQGSLGTVADASVFSWFQSYTDGSDGDTLAGTTPIQLNQWFHLAAVRDDAAKTVRLYVNGVEESSLSYAGKTVVALQQSKILGGSIPSFPTDFIDGQLDEVGIYNRALSLAEIQALSSGGSASNSSGVVVNLPLGTASGLTGGIAWIQNVVGSSGNDILVGNGGNVLTGGAGRDLLIAGASASILNGGDSEDILIGGTTDYDRDAAALMAIMAEWARTDADYATRVANLKNGTNGLPSLNADTVRSNGGGNTLTGNAGLDFFFANTDDLDTLDTLDRDSLTEELVEL